MHSCCGLGQVTILDRATHTKRIHIRKQASRHIVMDTEWETAPIEADTEDLELNAQPIPPTADLGESFIALL